MALEDVDIAVPPFNDRALVGNLWHERVVAPAVRKSCNADARECVRRNGRVLSRCVFGMHACGPVLARAAVALVYVNATQAPERSVAELPSRGQDILVRVRADTVRKAKSAQAAVVRPRNQLVVTRFQASTPVSTRKTRTLVDILIAIASPL